MGSEGLGSHESRIEEVKETEEDETPEDDEEEEEEHDDDDDDDDASWQDRRFHTWQARSRACRRWGQKELADMVSVSNMSVMHVRLDHDKDDDNDAVR